MPAAQALAKLIDQICTTDGLNPTRLPSVRCLRFSQTTPVRVGVWPQSFVIVVQGQKQIRLLKTLYKYNEAHYVATPIDLMVESRVKVDDPKTPYLAPLIDLNPEILNEVVSRLSENRPLKVSATSIGLFSGPTSERMLEASVRLLQSMASESEAEVLGALAIQELYFYLLTGPHGAALAQFAMSNGVIRKINRAVAELKGDLRKEVDIDAMAKAASMSRPTFFRAFKKHTSASPIQFMKALRLNEGQKLIRTRAVSVETAAYEVGYKSASQFSREYRRWFGRAPKTDKSSD